MIKSTRAKAIVRYAAAPLGILLSGVLVLVASQAAFSAQTSTGSNSWSTGTIDLTNDHEGRAVFAVDKLAPNTTDSKDVVVTYTGDYASDIRMFATSPVEPTGSLARNITLTIQRGTGSGASFTPDQNAQWAGTLADFDAIGSYANGVLGYQTPGSGAKTFRIGYTFAPTGDTTDLMGKNTGVTFTWAAETTS
ncbi:hypothetical protein ABZ816_34385 [Actinosynnema sp. NPDC047251]|uniref:Uncharacterized protein n=1 Tax=Saccharothrix espanaensis (strain ATCC 51144 / DSM 44229 / JCM 9112 / NBRC 15066 / NRRL 15764) TaxID=1179773 RepID=K0K1J8_SACES|nr:hypothetical protein [Saccharothrix espanaensis]CCH32211.1 hypothetical protein BN6_49410 [Saccharothrix espanaensis DSM 44229]